MNSIRFCANLGKNYVTETLSVIKQTLGKESMSQRDKATILPMEKSKLTEIKNGETGEEQRLEHVHHFSLLSKELFTKNSSWQAKQAIPHTIVRFYGDCEKSAKTSPRTLATDVLAAASRQRSVSQFLFN
jgi:hypothetical protein